jgi:hypothetical protein
MYMHTRIQLELDIMLDATTMEFVLEHSQFSVSALSRIPLHSFRYVLYSFPRSEIPSL